MAQSARLLDYVESYIYLGSQKTKIYTELNTDLKIDDRIYVVGGNFDNYALGMGAIPINPYAEFAMGYKILAIDTSQNWIVIDRDYDGTNVLASPTDEAFLSRGHFRKGQFNAGSFNDGIFGNNITPTEALFNNKQDLLGDYIPDAFVTHCVWLNGVWREGDWFSKTDSFKNFTSIKATLNSITSLVTIDTLSNGNTNNEGYGYNTWVNGTWENGHWFNGTWETGTWEYGEWDKGIFKSGDWLDGLKHNGIHTSINGRTNWLNGTHENGSMYDCFWEDGIFEDGVWDGANKFKIKNLMLPITAPYDTTGLHISVNLEDLSFLPIFQIGDEIMLSYVSVNGSYDNMFNMQPFIIQDITVNNELILLGTIPLSIDLSMARISNSRFRHGLWQNGTWASGYRRAGVEIDTNTIDDSIAGQVTLEIIDPISWAGSAVSVDYGLVIGETVILTNVTDSLGNDSENYTLTINGIIPGLPTTIVLTGAPVTWQLDLIVKESAEGIYVDNTVWENGKFSGGTWENGYFKTGEVNALRNSTSNPFFTHWRQGQWSLEIWTSTLNLHANWYNGLWEKGLFKHGEWHDGTWRNGTWDSVYDFAPVLGDSYSSHWRNGTWENGTWNIGEWDDGTWLNGQWNDGIIGTTDLSLQFYFPDTLTISGVQYLRFRFNGLTPFTIEPVVGDNVVINNTTDLILTPVVLLDSYSAVVTGTTYEIIEVSKDIGNMWSYITVNSPQNYMFPSAAYYLGDVSITYTSKNLHHDGDFLGGTWDNGIWNNGLFDNALTWNAGIFNDGTFQNSIWLSGDFIDGTFQNSTWYNGRFYNSIFRNSIWNNGEMFNGQMSSSTWNNGKFYDGLMTLSTINAGDFYGGEVNNVTMNNGNLYDGNLFKDSVMNNGTIDGAIFESSTKNGGTVLDGIIKGNSVHNSGTFVGGDWNNGLWNNGTWNTNTFEGNDFIYYTPGFGGTTAVDLFETDETNLILNGDFGNGSTNWTADPQWSFIGNTATASIPALGGAGTLDSNLIQSSVLGLSPGGSYNINFDILSNSHPFTGLAFPPKILVYIEIGFTTIMLSDTSIGNKTVNLTAFGIAPLDFTIRVQFLHVAGVAQSITIDNVSVETMISNTSSFSIGNEVWVSGLSYKFTAPDPLVPLTQKGIISSVNNGTLSIDFIGDFIVEKTNPTQERVYASKGIWRNGTLIGGNVNGMVFKKGNLIKPNMFNSVIEDGTANYEVDTLLTNPGLDLQSIAGWTGSPLWTIISGSAICVPNILTPITVTQTGILTNSDWYLVTLTVSSNANYLEDYVSILLGTNEYFLGSGVNNKTYYILGQAIGTDFSMQVTSKQLSLVQSSVILSNLKIEKVNITELTSSTWLNGTANGIYLNNSQWVDGTIQSAIFLDSVWEDGTCNFANFFDCNWASGIWNDGVWNATEAFDAKWENGTWNDGLFLNGELLCGDWYRGIWNKGMFRDGSLDGLTKFYGGAIQYGDVTLRSYPKKSFIIANLNTDSEGDTIKIKSNLDEIFLSITAQNNHAVTDTYKYPSGIFDPFNWGMFQPAWITNFRTSADWGSDEQKIIMRDVIDYHINNDGSYADIWDVDFIDGTDVTSDLSGDGMTTSPNTQTSSFLRFTRKEYIEHSITKSGSSPGFSPAGDSNPGLNRVHWLGGSYLGDATTTKLVAPTTYSKTINNGGFAEIWITENLTGQITGGDTLYMYGTGEFDNDVSNINNKDGLFNVTGVSWFGTETRILTTTPVMGVAPASITKSVELWVDAIDTEPSITTNATTISKVGRYFTYTLNGDHSAIIKKNLDIVFNGITQLTTLNYIQNGKIYNIKKVEVINIPGPIDATAITLDIKINSLVSTPVPDATITAKVFELADDIGNFCLGGVGPGPGPVIPPGPGGPL